MTTSVTDGRGKTEEVYMYIYNREVGGRGGELRDLVVLYKLCPCPPDVANKVVVLPLKLGCCGRRY